MSATKGLTDRQFVVHILDEIRGQPHQLIADRIVHDLGNRIRRRAREAQADVNQVAAAEVVREAPDIDS